MRTYSSEVVGLLDVQLWVRFSSPKFFSRDYGELVTSELIHLGWTANVRARNWLTEVTEEAHVPDGPQTGYR